MLAHNIADILTLAPEAKDMVKRASLDDDFPTNNKDSVCASYLRVQFLTKVAGKKVPADKAEFITKAASLYGVKEKLDQLAMTFNPRMEKTASQRTEELYNDFEFNCTGFKQLEKVAALAEQLQDSGFTGDQRVERYSGHMCLNKQAAVTTLANRYHATKDISFVKIAQIAAHSVKVNDFDSIRKLCHTVSELDKKAGLDVIGFDFYREALFTKEAACSALTVCLAGEEVPIEKLEKFGKGNIGAILGDEVAKDYGTDLVNNKYMLEALPVDSQRVLKTALKGI